MVRADSTQDQFWIEPVSTSTAVVQRFRCSVTGQDGEHIDTPFEHTLQGPPSTPTQVALFVLIRHSMEPDVSSSVMMSGRISRTSTCADAGRERATPAAASSAIVRSVLRVSCMESP